MVAVFSVLSIIYLLQTLIILLPHFVRANFCYLIFVVCTTPLFCQPQSQKRILTNFTEGVIHKNLLSRAEKFPQYVHLILPLMPILSQMNSVQTTHSPLSSVWILSFDLCLDLASCLFPVSLSSNIFMSISGLPYALCPIYLIFFDLIITILFAEK